MRSFLIALSFLTRLPVPRIDASAADFARAVRLYPFVGLLIGALVAGVAWAGALVDPWLGALAGVLAWTWVTGALHLDGLADLADGLGAAHGNRDRLLTVMADPHVGSFGVVALVLQIAAKLVLLCLLLPHGALAVMTVPAAARIGPLVWAWRLPPLRPGGLGASIAGAVRPRDLFAWAGGLIALCVVLPPLAITPLVLLALGAWFKRRIGGVTGDVHGAGIELTETALLVALLAQP
ncbi:adenosylcobinamide-GDP ribazoletransferase [Sphingomonas sp.]|uniref:adenosylcobinamide-GDP ribazoletransferase n=1 Tax=Sphingomonas sp. TaxID=28214 RepID=UPI002C2640BC|nr:adenosylcobinamide-GDP ribazoletransferase [Sphingomonas sp.]HTG38757.1 adenosylcobinamide-GDP ribazoletransferase [Sphingomonas sp.]